jgi:uncharacterized RDD family membrane protein YckC
MSSSIISPDTNIRRGVIGRRLIAFGLDLLIIGVLGWAGAFFILIFGFLTLGLGWLMFHILPWLPLLYYTGFIGGTGATPGQRMLGLEVRQEAGLQPPTLAQGLVFALMLGLSFVFAGLPFLLVLAGPGHRAAHDMLSGLVILRRPQMNY